MPAPATGSEISFGRLYKAFTNVAVNSPGDADVDGATPYSGSQNIKLSQILGTYADPPKAQGTEIKFSQTFGGIPTDYTY